jgi:hypothetical protein
MSSDVRDRRVRRTLVALLFLFLLWWLFSAVISDGTGSKAGLSSAESGSGSFVISGDITRLLSPGTSVPLDLQFTNPSSSPISVTGVTVAVSKVHAPHADRVHPCTVDDFTVNQVADGLKVTVAAGATNTLTGLNVARTQWPQVAMRNRASNQDGCVGASLTLAYAASGAVK